MPISLTNLSDWLSLFSKINLQSVLGALLFIVYWVYVFIIIYHLIRFGIGPQPKLLAFIFFIGSAAFLGLALVFYSQLNLIEMFQYLGQSYLQSFPF
mgnify:CR=1 FL=1